MDGDTHDPTRRERAHELRERVVDAAIAAELETGHHEGSVEDARRSVIWRMVRIVAGFIVVLLGIGATIGPGPGPLLIVVGLGMLPFAWAQRAVREIRKRTPGIPEDGAVPARTWAVLGLMVGAYATVAIVWGDDLVSWVSGLWGDPNSLFL